MLSAEFGADLKISANLQFVIAKFEKDAISCSQNFTIKKPVLSDNY